MRSRTASLQVAHQKACPSHPRNSIDSLDGCQCRVAYFTMYRDDTGRKVIGDHGDGRTFGRTYDRREADRWLARVQDRLEQGHTQPDRVKSITFPDWVAEYKADFQRKVDRGVRKQRTLASYTRTLDVALDAFGHLEMRKIGKQELQRFADSYGDATDGTLASGFRELAACLNAAVDEEYLERNPCRVFVKRLELAPRGRGKDPFTDDELPRLWAAMAGSADPVYLSLCRVAVETGARLGELTGLDWDKVNVPGRTLRIEQTYHPKYGITAPKTRSSIRTVYLTAPALREFLALDGGTGPVFTGPHGERLSESYVARVLDRAMEAAKIPKPGETGLPRSFHSFRSTFDRRMLEQGRHPEWIRRQLGHAGLEMTLQHYGQWSAAAMAAEAAKVDENE
jgi:integrase